MSLGLLIIAGAGLSVDVLIAVAYQGALLARINKKDMILVMLIFGAWQFAALGCGRLITYIPLFIEKTESVTDAWDKLAAIIFLLIGLHFVCKAADKKNIAEKRMNIRYKKINTLAILTSLDVFLAGIAFGFLQVSFVRAAVVLEVITVGFVFAGMYLGYRLGYRQNRKVYLIGAAMMICTGTILLIHLC